MYDYEVTTKGIKIKTKDEIEYNLYFGEHNNLDPSSYLSFQSLSVGCLLLIGSLRYGDYGLRTTAGRALSFVCSTGLSRANIER